MKSTRVLVVAVSTTFLVLPLSTWAQHDLTHDQPAVTDAAVDFGVLPLPATTPLGGPPCLQANNPPNTIGGPTDPCSYKLHHLTPEEVTVVKGGQVTFQVHGGGHGFAIYEVSKNTTRDELGQFLCPGTDPETITNPTDHTCNLTANSNALHNIADGKGDIVIVASASTSPNPVPHPENRVWYEPGRLMSVGGQQFINGGTTATNGQLLTYRFLKTGRYLVICINRVHFLNDWMFGFVNVVGE